MSCIICLAVTEMGEHDDVARAVEATAMFCTHAMLADAKDVLATICPEHRRRMSRGFVRAEQEREARRA